MHCALSLICSIRAGAAKLHVKVWSLPIEWTKNFSFTNKRVWQVKQMRVGHLSPRIANMKGNFYRISEMSRVWKKKLIISCDGREKWPFDKLIRWKKIAHHLITLRISFAIIPDFTDLSMQPVHNLVTSIQVLVEEMMLNMFFSEWFGFAY